ncbi:G-protein alpha subunit-domain-containing protein [Mycena galopus ATCC 62051]|nr:G-protein alpha subunit-domain-containing protein [Mycena galopus ATCC 62051]
MGSLRGKTTDENPSAASCVVMGEPTAPARKMASANAGWNTSSMAVQFERRAGIPDIHGLQQESFEHWRVIVGNSLFSTTTLILLFNKKDLLQKQIDAGVKVNQYVSSYRDRPNDVVSATKYFRDQFSACHRKFSPQRRPFLCYETNATDSEPILKEVGEQIIRNHFKDLNVM